MDGEESALLATINAHRQANGRAPLTLDVTLTKAAAWMSADSARRGMSPSDHIDSLGRDIPSRLADCGYTSASKENVYWGQGVDVAGRDWASRDSAVRFWSVDPPAHNAAMLDPQMTAAGIARACQDGKCHLARSGRRGRPAQPPAQPPPPSRRNRPPSRRPSRPWGQRAPLAGR